MTGNNKPSASTAPYQKNYQTSRPQHERSVHRYFYAFHGWTDRLYRHNIKYKGNARRTTSIRHWPSAPISFPASVPARTKDSAIPTSPISEKY